MNTILAWLKSKSWSTHSIAIVLASVATFITTDQQAQHFIVQMLKTHPAIATQIIAFAGIIVAYKHSQSPAGTVANAEQIMTSPNAPTSSQIEAATIPAAPAKPVLGGEK